MTIRNLITSGLLGLSLAVSTAPLSGYAETLKVVKGSPSNSLNVPMNRAIVVETETSFGEVSVANPSIADISTLSDKTIYVLGKAPGRTTLTLLDGTGRLISNVDVHVTPDVAEFKERLQQILPGEPIEVRTANDGIVMSGTVSSIGKLDRALDLANRYAPNRVSNLMSVGGTQQVMLKIRFAEMQRSVAKNLTGSLAFSGSLGGNAGATGASQTFSDGSNLANLYDGDSSTSATSSQDRDGLFSIGFSNGTIGFQVLLEALETKGVVRTLAEPNLTALSGQKADFLAGGEYPTPAIDDNGSPIIEYKPFGIEMEFTPTVVDGDLINLQLKTSVSSLDTSISAQNSAGFTVFGFKTRKASTTVEMRDGQSFAIAGLLQDDFTDQSGQVPWLGDVPIIGALFRSSEYERKQSELVVIVTPHLVTPTRGEALALPTDRVQIPTERELFLFGNVAGKKKIKGAAGEVARQDFSGSYGYVMD
ncbi:MAG: type II and III secretion system protein family protein [Paracoccaceae bacterium]|nr:type II and III secretion system protein family protein [Paracoccaceae bacterium]